LVLVADALEVLARGPHRDPFRLELLREDVAHLAAEIERGAA